MNRDDHPDETPLTRRALIQGASSSWPRPRRSPHRRSRSRPAALAPEAAKPAASPPPRADVGPVLKALTGYMTDAQSRALPDEAAEHTKLHILDTMAAMISGADLAPGQAALKCPRTCTVVPARRHRRVLEDSIAGPVEAALANAMMAHADETDDSHAPSQSHPGCSVVPAALAAGELFRNDGNRFLRAVALGYDIGTRVNMTLGPVNFEVGNHQSSHAFAGIWGSAAAAGCAAGHSQTRSRMDGCSTTPAINRADSPSGSATPITFRRHSRLPASARATGSVPRCSSTPDGRASTIFSRVRTISSSRTAPTRTRRSSSRNSASATK